MRAPAPRSTRALSLAAVVATVAVFVVPVLVATLRGYTGEGSLAAAAESAFVRADLGGQVADSRALAELTARWREFHVVKAALAGLLVLVLVGLTSRLRQAVEAAGPGRQRGALIAAYGGVVGWLLGALTVLLANVQGAMAPLASVASLLPAAGGTGELGGVLAGLRRAVEADPPPAGGLAEDLLGDFTRYHAVLAVLAAVAAVVLLTLALAAVSGRWRLRGTRRSSSQPTWAVRAALHGAAGAFFLLLSLANTSTWVDPVPALVATLGSS